MTRPLTIAGAWQEAVAERPGEAPFLVEHAGSWRAVAWDEAAELVDALAAGFAGLGVRKATRVAIFARTRHEWALCDYALASLGAVSVPLYPTSPPGEVAYVLTHARPHAVVCEGRGEVEIVAGLRGRVPSIERVVSFDEVAGALSLAALAEQGRERLRASPDLLARARAAVAEDDVYTIIYTSGTTGASKGCVLTHRNYRVMLDSVDRVPRLFGPGDVALLHLPLAHTFGRLLVLVVTRGVTIAFCPDTARLREALVGARPTILPSVPRVYETVYRAVRAGFQEATGLRRRLIDWALATGRRTSALRESGQPLPRSLAAQHALADKLVYSRVKARLGGRLRIAISGGAPLPADVGRFFHALDILIVEGYGLTEATTVLSVNHPDRYRFGTVGLVVPGVEVALADDGEILARGETVFEGYLDDPAGTAEVLAEDGWLRTGDVGRLDGDGFLTITDRKKDLIVTAGGKNVSPLRIETLLQRSPLVSQAFVAGDGLPHLVALIAPNPQEARKLESAAELRSAVHRVVDEANAELSPAEQVRRFAVLDREFSLEEGELTPTLKLRRRAVQTHFAHELERLANG